jgi:hypothetical protein
MLNEPQHGKVPSNNLEPETASGQPMIYQIRVKSHLGSDWTDWFEGLTITLEDDGDMLLTGPVVDQAALHGLLKKVRDLGIPLVSIIPVQCNETRLEKESKK